MIRILTKWKNYRHRFLPWLALNLPYRVIPESEQLGKNHIPSERIIAQIDLEKGLKKLLAVLEKPHKSIENTRIIFGGDSRKRRDLFEKFGRTNREILLRQFGFEVEIRNSGMPGAGKGVFVKQGSIKCGQVVALYPGIIYQSYQPILLQSIGNPYIFRCADGIHIDGNYQGLSALLYKSIHSRDRIGSQIPVCDISWLHLRPIMKHADCGKSVKSSDVNLNMVINPLNIGQIVNNANPKMIGYSANLAYQELTITLGEETDTFNDILLLGLLPNVYYAPEALHSSGKPNLKTIPLVATRDIVKGEELLSTYFTLVGA